MRSFGNGERGASFSLHPAPNCHVPPGPKDAAPFNSALAPQEWIPDAVMEDAAPKRGRSARRTGSLLVVANGPLRGGLGISCIRSESVTGIRGRNTSA